MDDEKLYSNVLVKEEFIPLQWANVIEWITGGFEMTIRIGELEMIASTCDDCVPSITEWHVEKGKDSYAIESDKTQWKVVDNRTWYEKDMDMGPDPVMQWWGTVNGFHHEQMRIFTEVITLILDESNGNLENIIVKSRW